MTYPGIYPRAVRSRKKNITPLSKLRTSDVVKIVVDHPRRLEELVSMLEDKDRNIRGRAAATLARLSESHPSRLIRVLVRLREGLSDDAAYVRWHLAYTLGKLGSKYPVQSSRFLNDLGACLDDENRIVRFFTCKALIQVAVRKPVMIEEFFRNKKKEIPPAIARILKSSRPKSRNAGNR